MQLCAIHMIHKNYHIWLRTLFPGFSLLPGYVSCRFHHNRAVVPYLQWCKHHHVRFLLFIRVSSPPAFLAVSVNSSFQHIEEHILARTPRGARRHFWDAHPPLRENTLTPGWDGFVGQMVVNIICCNNQELRALCLQQPREHVSWFYNMLHCTCSLSWFSWRYFLGPNV